MGSNKAFTGRERELAQLKSFSRQTGAQLAVIKGRRRVGKSRLIQEFAQDFQFFSFAGLAPIKGMTAQSERDAFGRQLAHIMGISPVTFTDWTDAFHALTSALSEKPTVILLDEISWMATDDPTFVPKLKNWWDLEISRHPEVVVIICGSVSTWIEENILNSTSFFGRIGLTIHLNPLSLVESCALLRARGFKGSLYEVYKILAVTGGIPWYLEQIQPDCMADDNIKRLCFEKNGLLTTEFEKIFHDLFGEKGSIYKKILRILQTGLKTLADIRKELNYSHSGTLSEFMQNLIVAGFVTQHAQWSLKTGKTAKQTLYRLSDSYSRFYLKYIEPNHTKIHAGHFADIELESLPGWLSTLGVQIENLLLDNRAQLLKSLDITNIDLVGDNPYIQKATARKKGCQIDYLVQTRQRNIFVCEFKFKRNELSTEIIDEMKEKIAKIQVPRGFAIIPVLFHLGGVSESVEDKQYFYRMVDITHFL